MAARLIEIDSRSHQPSDSQTAGNQGNLPSFSDQDFRSDLHNLPKDTQTTNLPNLQIEGYDHKVAHPAEDVEQQPGVQQLDDNGYDYRKEHTIDYSSKQNDANKLPDLQINNADYDPRNNARRPADNRN